MIKFCNEAWARINFGDIAQLSNLSCDPVEENIERFVAGEHMETDELRIRKWGIVKNEILGPAFHRKFQQNQILYGSRRTYLRKVAIAHFEGVCANTTFVIKTVESKAIVAFIALIMQTERFVKHSIHNSKGSTNPFINWKDIASYIVNLPEIEEQRQIVTLFQSIETAIEQVEEQEQRLKLLWKNLINGFVNDKPKFGNLLSDKALMKVNYREVTKKIMQKIDPVKYGVERMVAGENLESENFKISTWGDVRREFLGPAFHVLFHPGDILYGSRRTYLKKVAVADFEGVCANTTFVIRAEEDILLQSLLKHIMLSDEFTKYSVGVSKGSTNPYINWKDLDNFSFFIPDIETQKEITTQLDKIIDLIQLHKFHAKTLKKLKQQLLNEILG